MVENVTAVLQTVFSAVWAYWRELSGENDNDEINVAACPTCTNNQNGQFLFTDTRAGRR